MELRWTPRMAKKHKGKYTKPAAIFLFWAGFAALRLKLDFLKEKLEILQEKQYFLKEKLEILKEKQYCLCIYIYII